METISFALFVLLTPSLGHGLETAPPQSRCSLEPESGPCKVRVLAWFYNFTSGTCEKFVFGGCQGNANNFETKEECDSSCLGKEGNEEKTEHSETQEYPDHTENEQSPCEEPPERGPCRAFFERYYYNNESKQCETFIYGGCQGNENNFESKEECEAQCAEMNKEENPCELPVEPGPCKGSFLRYYYDKETKKCEKFIYGGCNGNANNFDSLNECQVRCDVKKEDQEETQENPCELPAETGPCRASFPRYYYNGETKKCESFTYGGCRGNANNFVTIAECEAKCAEKKEDEKEGNPCELPAETGPCKASFTRYYYNRETKKCETFTYGGCLGNENNFAALAECEAKCAGKKEEEKEEDPCVLPALPGPCKARFTRYFFNKESKQCEAFTYGGCEGNANNFETKAECEKRCPVEKSEPAAGREGCDLPKDSGPCRSYVRKWYFDTQSMVCKLFMYGGCGGNANRFDSKEACQERCVATLPASAICRLPCAPGSCRTKSTRWYYNVDKGSCDTFVYTGCEGNMNNFRTEAECSAKCSSV